VTPSVQRDTFARTHALVDHLESPPHSFLVSGPHQLHQLRPFPVGARFPFSFLRTPNKIQSPSHDWPVRWMTRYMSSRHIFRLLVDTAGIGHGELRHPFFISSFPHFANLLFFHNRRIVSSHLGAIKMGLCSYIFFF